MQGNNEWIEYQGTAASDKEENSIYLEVFCPSLLPNYNGPIQPREVVGKVSIEGNTPAQSYIKMKSTIKCIYRGDDPHDSKPPDVRKGEQVIVMKYGDTNTYYWKSSGANNQTRRTERHRISISDTPDPNPTLDDNNTYFIELDTREHHQILISTAKSCGEAYAYKFLISPETDSVTLTDDAMNTLIIDSKNSRIALQNHYNSTVILDKDNIQIACTKDITIKSEQGNINICAANGEMALASRGDMSLETQSKLDETSTKDMTFNTKAKYNATSTSDMLLYGKASNTIKSDGPITIEAGGGLSMSFVGSGSCTCSGGNLTMKLNNLNVVKG